jgi:hypothetical protein
MTYICPGRPRDARPRRSRPSQRPARRPVGQPGVLPAHHSRLLRAAERARRPATSAGKQQLSRRAEGPVRRDIGPWRTLPRHGGLTMTRGLKADAEQRDQTRAPRNRDPRQAEAGPLVKSCPGPARAPAAADVNDGPVTTYAVSPVGMQDSRIWVASVLNRKRADSRAERTDTRAVMIAEPSAISRPQRAGAGGGCSVWGATGRRPLPQKARGRLCAVHADLPGLCRRHRRCVRPQIPGLSPGGLGPHLTSSGLPCGLSSGFPFARRVLPLRPPSSGFPSSGVLRFGPFGRCPVPVLLRFPSGFPFP